MCDRCVAELAELEVQLAELEVDALELAADVEAGRVPPWARRGLYPHERAAGVNFADVDATLQARAGRLSRLLTEHRDTFAGQVAEQLRAARTPGELADVVARLTDPARGLGRDLDGYGAATRALERQVAAELRAAYGEGLTSIAAEAEAQGVPAAALDALEVPAAVAEEVAQRSAASAAAPGRAIVEQLAAEAARANLYDLALGDAADRLATAAAEAGAKGLDTDAARVPVQQMAATGRRDGLRALPAARTYYASELLDRNTCGPCSFVDGVQYSSLEAGEEDYPGGTYIGCEGGARCRGTLVAVWEAEAPPTVEDVAPVDRPEPPGPPPAGPGPDAPPSPPTADPDPAFSAAEAGPPDTLDAAPPPVVERDLIDEVADELGVDRAEVLAARAQLADVRRALRAEAAETQLTARDWFVGGPSPLDGTTGPQMGHQLRTPPKRRQVEDRFGRKVWTRADPDGKFAGEYDWIDDLDPGELRRLQRRGWFSPEGTPPDELYQLAAEAAGAAESYSFDDAVQAWRHHASLQDAAGAVARGKLPSGDHLATLDEIAPNLAAEGWDLGLILGADGDRAALVHVLTKEADEVGRMAARDLFSSFTGNVRESYAATLGPAPWKMTAESYRLELLDVEAEIATARDLGQAIPAAAVRRWHELVPLDDLDEHGAPLDTETLHGLIVELARLAQKGGWL